MTDLIDTTEMYLRTIFELEEEGITPLRARIAERLGHSGPTVSQTVARMERDGLLHRRRRPPPRAQRPTVGSSPPGSCASTASPSGCCVDVIGLEWEFVHDEACRWEHVMSERVERKILALLGRPRRVPYGNPIPGLDELGEEPSEALPARA